MRLNFYPLCKDSTEHIDQASFGKNDLLKIRRRGAKPRENISLDVIGLGAFRPIRQVKGTQPLSLRSVTQSVQSVLDLEPRGSVTSLFPNCASVYWWG